LDPADLSAVVLLARARQHCVGGIAAEDAERHGEVSAGGARSRAVVPGDPAPRRVGNLARGDSVQLGGGSQRARLGGMSPCATDLPP